MDCNYPHWYNNECAEPNNDMGYNCYDQRMCGTFPDASFKDRLLGMLGCKIIFSVDARVCGRETLCGSLCYVGCDFIIVNLCMHRKSLSMYIPICMIRFLALDK
ncbi:hypothetical protein [Anaerosinus massiliensis]|uniref:hypothetical protein n=1 Tax=Massilibacillus massiliensis TaxID=1806837 RepID=UPI000DA626A7|nr:hypothetical protein [Massilibacillus massiliensis]